MYTATLIDEPPMDRYQCYFIVCNQNECCLSSHPLIAADCICNITSLAMNWPTIE